METWDPRGRRSADVCRVLPRPLRAHSHALSGMMNLGQFLGLADGAMRRGGRSGATLAVVMIDLDGLSKQAEAHHAADRVRGAAIARITRGIRWTDAATCLSSGQIAVLCENLRGPAEADRIAARLRRAFEQPVEVDGTSHAISARTGVALASGPADDAATVVAGAGAALRAARDAADKDPVEAVPAASVTGRSLRGRRRLSAGPGHADAISDIDMKIELTSGVIRRISGVALTLASAASLVDGLAAARVHDAVDELDTLIRDIRANVFELLIPPPAADDE